MWVALWFLVSSIAKNFSYLDTTHWIRCKSVLLHVCIDIATRPLRNLLILSPPSVHNSQSQHSQRAWLTNELYFHLFVWLAFPIWTIRVHLEFWLARSLLCFPEDYHLWLWYKCVIDQEWVNTPRYWSINIPEKITLSKFRLSWLSVMLFQVHYWQVMTWFRLKIGVISTCKLFKDYKLHLLAPRARAVLLSFKNLLGLLNT